MATQAKQKRVNLYLNIKIDDEIDSNNGNKVNTNINANNNLRKLTANSNHKKINGTSIK